MLTAPLIPTEPSLLPYVDPGKAGLRIQFTGLREESNLHDPLAGIETSGCLAAIVEGAIIAGRGEALTDLFFLVQPDRYPAIASQLSPLTNPDVEQLWQDAASRVQALHPDAFCPLLPDQTDADGHMVPWRSLFYCRHTQRYGHPLCPQCGGVLTLCRDDRILQAADLPAYTRSLERFLHCPACHRHAHTTLFYTRQMPADPPAHVVGADRLIEGFSRLLSRHDLAGALPCVGCDQIGDCYGPQTLVHQRMTPLFFYPFHMLGQTAPDLNVLEFLDVLSGTAIERIDRRLAMGRNAGRLRKWRQCRRQFEAGDGLLFEQEQQRFGEVFYLKLSLLDALFDMVRQADGRLAEPVAGMSLESLWVRLPATASRLPFCWNFSLQLIDVLGRPQAEAAPDPLSHARARTFLGMAWCRVLLVNERQDMQTVMNHVASVWTPDADRPEQSTTWRSEPVFDAANLVGFEHSSPLDADWERLWQTALEMGFDLLRAGRTADVAWSDDRFGERMALLLRAVHAALFQAAAPGLADPAPLVQSAQPAPVGPDVDPKALGQAHDAAIATLLRTLLAQWPQPAADANKIDLDTDADAADSGIWRKIPESAEGDFQATVILGSESAFNVQEPPPPPDLPELDQTVLLDAGKHVEPPGNTIDSDRTLANPPPVVEEIEETVVLEPSATLSGTADDLQATVMLDPHGPIRTPHGTPHSTPPAQDTAAAGTPAMADAGDDMDDLEQTVIMPPRNRQREPKP
jgi:hypothetical protein